MMNHAAIQVLLVEDSPGDARLIVEALAEAGRHDFQVKHVERLSQAIQAANHKQIDIILLDLSLPDAHGESTVDRISAAAPTIPIVIITGLNDERLAVRLVGRQVQDYLVKGQVDSIVLARSIRYAIERKKILVALSASEARYRAIVEDQTELICRFAPDGTLTFVNEAFASYLAQRSETLIGQNFVSLFSGEDLEALEASFASLSPENPTSTVEYRVNTSHGDDRWQQWNNRAMFSSDLYFTEFQVVGRDITRRKRAEEALRDSEEKFRSIVETTNEWIWTVDADGRLIYSNRAVETILGYPVEQLIAQEIPLIVHPEDLPHFQSTWREHARNAQGWSGLILRWCHRDGSYRYLESNAVPILSPSGTVIGFRGADRDITERKQREAQALSLEVERERARLFQRFVGGVSHDLRTPLTIMYTSLDLLGRTLQSPQQVHHLDKLREQAIRFQSTIEDLFTLSRLDIETDTEPFTPLNLNEIVEAVCAQQRQVAAKKQHHVILRLDEHAPQVMGDGNALTQAVKHLLVNALNYTPDGGVIRITTCQQDHQAIFRIEDNGIGISAEDLPQIFERFYRADKARSSETGGSGLGLAITKKIVETHGGHIGVESTPGQGSTFCLSLAVIEEGKP